MTRPLAIALVTSAALLAACAPTTRIIQLPADVHAVGTDTAVVDIATAQDKAQLAQPWSQATVNRHGGIKVHPSQSAKVQKRHAPLLAAQPAAAQTFTVYFNTGGRDLTNASKNTLDKALALANEWPGGEIIVVGHTDRVGSAQRNDQLSLQRAQAIRELLIQRGFDARRIEAVGRGERDLAVPTADDVAEARNRRTVIIVR